MYLGQHHPHTILGTVIDQNVNSLPGVPRMQNCTTDVIFLSISRQKMDVFCFFFSNILFTFISFYFSVSFTPGTSVWQVPRQRPASCLGGCTGRKMFSVLLMSVQHLLGEQSWAHTQLPPLAWQATSNEMKDLSAFEVTEVFKCLELTCTYPMLKS